jgi:hypothetical protein
MKKFGAVFVMAGALLVARAGATQGPDLDLTAKKEAKSQMPPAPVTAPLCIGTAFNATLVDVIDTRRAKSGDPVTAEVAENVTYERTVIFPKGTKVVGHILRATSGGRGRAGSALFVQFDKAILKDGQEVLLNAGIQALAVSQVAPQSDTERSSTDGATSAEANPPAEPLVEGAEPASTTSTNDALIVSTIYDTSRRGLRPPLFAAPAAEGELNSDGMFTPDSKGAFGRPDVKVYTPTSQGSHGTVLLSAKKHMHLDSGTRLLLVVQPPPSGEFDPLQMDELKDVPPNF